MKVDIDEKIVLSKIYLHQTLMSYEQNLSVGHSRGRLFSNRFQEITYEDEHIRTIKSDSEGNFNLLFPLTKIFQFNLTLRGIFCPTRK